MVTERTDNSSGPDLDTDPGLDPETGRQFRVEAHGGHFGGSLDGVALGLLEELPWKKIRQQMADRDAFYRKNPDLKRKAAS